MERYLSGHSRPQRRAGRSFELRTRLWRGGSRLFEVLEACLGMSEAEVQSFNVGDRLTKWERFRRDAEPTPPEDRTP
jgi:hypothetical protein